MRLFDVIAATPGKLPEAAASLRDRFTHSTEALAPWSPAPSQDPLGRFLLAVARNQIDRSLSAFWFSMCRLPASVPLFRAEYAVAGLRGLPRPSEAGDDEFPYEVASGLRALTHGIAIAVDDARTDRESGEELLVSITAVAMAAYPLGGWSAELLLGVDDAPPMTAELLHRLSELDERAATQELLSRMLQRQPQSGARAGPERTGRAPGRLERSGQQSSYEPVLKDITKGRSAAVNKMLRTVTSERTRAERSGDWGNEFARLLVKASTAARRHFASQSVEWAEEALNWEPWDARTWTTLTAALRAAGRFEDVLDAGWRSYTRFPYDYFISVELSQALAAQHRLPAAEAVLVEAMRDFPDEAPPISAYAELLLSTGRPTAAVELLSGVVERFLEADDLPANAENLWAGLTAALIGTGDVEMAKEIATNAADLFTDGEWARKMPAGFEVFRRERVRRDAEYSKRSTPPLSNDVTLFSVLGEARVLRQTAPHASEERRLAEAKALLDRHRPRWGGNSLFVAESTLLLVDSGEPERALKELRQTVFVDVVDPSVAVATARAKRAALLSQSASSATGTDPRHYRPPAFDALTSEVRAAASSNSALRPLSMLASLQAAAVMVDGPVLERERRRLLSELSTWTEQIRGFAAPNSGGAATEEFAFARPWADSVRDIWTGLGQAPSGAEIATRACEKANALDHLEETFEHRVAVLA
jgi:tetratricopeptide (TPR) repeat protein